MKSENLSNTLSTRSNQYLYNSTPLFDWWMKCLLPKDFHQVASFSKRKMNTKIFLLSLLCLLAFAIAKDEEAEASMF